MSPTNLGCIKFGERIFKRYKEIMPDGFYFLQSGDPLIADSKAERGKFDVTGTGLSTGVQVDGVAAVQAQCVVV
jgi:hypothetical protein